MQKNEPHITQREWDWMVDKLESLGGRLEEQSKNIENINHNMIRLIEREDSRDGRVLLSQKTADDAVALAQQNRLRITALETLHVGTSKTLDGWTGLIIKVVGALTVAGVAGLVGYIIK